MTMASLNHTYSLQIPHLWKQPTVSVTTAPLPDSPQFCPHLRSHCQGLCASWDGAGLDKRPEGGELLSPFQRRGS